MACPRRSSNDLWQVQKLNNMNLRRFIFHFMSEPGESLKTSLNRAFSPHSVVPSVLEHHGHASLTPNFNGEREILSSSPSGESQSLTSQRTSRMHLTGRPQVVRSISSSSRSNLMTFCGHWWSLDHINLSFTHIITACYTWTQYASASMTSFLDRAFWSSHHVDFLKLEVTKFEEQNGKYKCINWY